MTYEAVIGLEIHVQLLTQSKAYCSDSAEYGAMPNTQVSPITLAHPGTLPKHNLQVVEKAITMGLALGCDISRFNQFDRKNYFYADLPKGYQITQDKTPICKGGAVKIKLKDGREKSIGLTRIHMEEDSGKSMHDQDLYDTLVDYNRAGVPLIEIVSEPELRSAEEAYEYVSELRQLVRYLGICDGNMEEGSMRCDANISIRPVGASTFGTKVEVKNMNSISNVKRAIESEIIRQTELTEQGIEIISETRGFNALKGNTFSMRSKEAANDYRYFPEPDLPPFVVEQSLIDRLQAEMPQLPEAIYAQLKNEFGLSDYDAKTITDDQATAMYYLQLTQHSKNYKAVANWLLGPIKSYLNETASEIAQFPVSFESIAALIALIEEGLLSHTAAAQMVFPKLIESPGLSPLAIAEQLNVIQSQDSDLIDQIVSQVIGQFPEKVQEYKAGKKGLLGLFVGEAMKLSKGKADPKVLNQAMSKALEA
jgi:aspartyl-tRNA(Asn)/glutamyl-tRNA(Gln) amidotransferase subunit B